MNMAEKGGEYGAGGTRLRGRWSRSSTPSAGWPRGHFYLIHRTKASRPYLARVSGLCGFGKIGKIEGCFYGQQTKENAPV